MSSSLKNLLYFPIAYYFRIFAAIRLKRWKPRVVVVTGSSGKTTLLHLLESQFAPIKSGFGDKAKYSHHANSSYGVAFDILDLHRKTLRTSEWVSLFLRAPINVFKKLPKEQIYVVEADTDRPGEGKFLAELLKPEVVLWVSVSATHAMNFDKLVKKRVIPTEEERRVEGSHSRKVGERDSSASLGMTFESVEDAIAYDFGYFLEYCSKLAVIDGDLPLIIKQTERTKAKVKNVMKKDLEKYEVERYGAEFVIEGEKYLFPALLPREVFYSIAMCKEAVEYFDLPFDKSFSKFVVPEGRGSLFEGVKDTALIDSSYNANLSSMEAMLSMFAKFPAEKKWVVLGDMLELGEKEQAEHERLGEILGRMDLEKIVLVGKRVGKYTLPKLKSPQPPLSRGSTRESPSPLDKGGARRVGDLSEAIVGFESQSDALHYLQEQIMGGEAILFKGSQSLFLEGIIEPLLKDKKDASKLPRRGIFWRNKRRQLGL